MVDSLHIPTSGVAGLSVGNDDPGSPLIAVPYQTNIFNGCLIFDRHAWRAFHIEEDDLQVRHAVLITARTTRRRGLNILFVVDILPDSPVA